MDTLAPDDTPYTFWIRTKKREYCFGLCRDEERKQWLKHFDMLLGRGESTEAQSP